MNKEEMLKEIQDYIKNEEFRIAVNSITKLSK